MRYYYGSIEGDAVARKVQEFIESQYDYLPKYDEPEFLDHQPRTLTTNCSDPKKKTTIYFINDQDEDVQTLFIFTPVSYDQTKKRLDFIIDENHMGQVMDVIFKICDHPGWSGINMFVQPCVMESWEKCIEDLRCKYE